MVLESREEALQELRELITSHQSGCDLKICSLVAAAVHYRRATVCTPFPGDLFAASPADRDFDALRACLDGLPGVAALANREALARLPTQQLLLLHWLLTHPRRPAAHISRVRLEDVRQSLPTLTGWLSDVVHNPSLRPQAILQLQAPSPNDWKGKVLAFHGTRIENVHSILHMGLLNASGTRLERTGAAFGKGIYFSTELTVAFAFCHPGPSWPLSALGSRQRCLFLCGIDKDHAKLDGDSQVPDKYIVVDRPDVVTLYYAFIYSDDADFAAGPEAVGAAHLQQPGGPGAGQQAQQAAAGGRPYLLPCLAAAYLLWLVSVGLRDNWPAVRRLVWRYLRVRLP